LLIILNSEKIEIPQTAVWRKPYLPYYKINYDIAIRNSFSAQSVVCKDLTGKIIQGSTIISHSCMAVYDEATAALLVVRLALSLKLSSFTLEGDSLIVTLLFKILQLHKTRKFRPPSPTSIPSSHQQLAGQLVISTEIQTYVSIISQTEPQLNSPLTAFPINLFSLIFFLPVLEKNLLLF
jgi:hypothetical protein